MESAISTQKQSFWSVAKKYAIQYLVTALITAGLMLIPFYYNTQNDSKNNEDAVIKNTNDIEELKKTAVETKINNAAISNIQKQFDELNYKVDKLDSKFEYKITALDSKIDNKFTSTDAKIDKIYDVLIKKNK